MDNSTHSILLAFALITFATAFVLYFIPFNKYFKNKDFSKFFLLKDKVFYILSYVCLLASFILFDVQFYTNVENITFITETLKTSLDVGHAFMIYGGSVFLSLGLFAVVSLFIQYFYFFENVPVKKKKVLYLLLGASLFTVISFVIFVEGNAPYLRYPLANRIYFGSSGVKLVTINLGYNWSPIPSGDSFGFNVAFYALCLLGGGIVVFLIDSYKLRVIYGQRGLLTNVFLIGFPTGVVGCRLWYVIGNWERDGFNKDPLKIFAINDGGLAIMGASLAIIVCIIYLLVIKYKLKKDPYTKMNYLMVFDLCIISILFAQALGRWGNFFNNEVHGNYVSEDGWNWLPLLIKNNMHFSSNDSEGRAYSLEGAMNILHSGKIFVPLFLVEGIINTVGYFVLEYGIRIGFKKLVEKHGKKGFFSFPYFISCDGACGGWYFIWYGATRAVLEPLRSTSFNMGLDNNWSFYSSFAMIGVGVLLIIFFSIWQHFRDKGKFILKVKEESNE